MYRVTNPHTAHPTSRAPQRCDAIDIHETMKREMLKQGGTQDTSFRFGLNAPASLDSGSTSQAYGPNPAVGFEDTEVYLDSVRKSTEDLANGLVSFDITPLNNNIPLSNIIQVNIGEVYFPRVHNPRAQLDPVNYASLALVPNSPDFFYYRRLHIQIVNFPFAQAAKAINNAYHWEMQVDELNSNAVKLTPIKPSFFLPRPITTLSEIQLRFLVPQALTGIVLPVKLTPDVVTISPVTPGTNPIRFRIVDNDFGAQALNLFTPPAIRQNRSPPDAAQIPLPGGGVLPAPGVAVFITGFVGGTGPGGLIPNVRVQNLVNSTTGVFITRVINIKAPSEIPEYVFEIADIDGTLDGVITGPVGTTAQMIIAQKRFAIPIRFTGIKDQLTNYISVFHN
jgi:hypothetical protein